jgi:hypothetical protein
MSPALRLATIRRWESTWGREGLWCLTCRRATPVEQLLLCPVSGAVLPCERCGRVLRRDLVVPAPRRPDGSPTTWRPAARRTRM